MSDQPAVEKYVTFTLTPTGKWDVQMWADDAYIITGKVYRIMIAVPSSELVGSTIQATIEPIP